MKIAAAAVMRRFTFKKKFKLLLSEKCEKIPIESISLQKRNIYSIVSQTVRRGRVVSVPRVYLKCFTPTQVFCQN